MPWHKFVFTKEFWKDGTPVYVAMAVFFLMSAIIAISIVFGGSQIITSLWALSFVAVMASMVFTL